MDLRIYRAGTFNTVVKVDDGTVRVQKLLGENYIKLNQVYNDVADIEIGDYITWETENYYVNSLPNVNKISGNQFHHEVTFEHEMYDMAKVQFMTGGESDFYLIGDLETFIDLIVTNMNRVYGGSTWAKGTVTASQKDTYKNLHFSRENCLAVLQRLCDEYSGEFSVTSKTISFVDTVGNVTGLSFSYGSGNGLRSISRQSVNNANIVTRLYAYGSNKNLDYNYRSGKRRLEFETGGNNYVEKNTATYGTIEYTEYFEDVYPHRTGSISTINTSNVFMFTDGSMDFNVNSYLIGGVTPKVHFQTGDLAGFEFEISAYAPTGKTFTILPYTDEYVQTIPNTTLKPAIGDQYVITDITMPTSYITTAESLLLSMATAYLNANCEPIVTYQVGPDWRFLKASGVTLFAGDEITIVDSDLGINTTTRITSLTQKLWSPYQYDIEVSNNIQMSLIQRLYAGQRDQILKNEISNVGDIYKTQWGWYTQRGEHTARTWATDSGLPGHKKRVLIDKENNRLSLFNEDGNEVIRLDDNPADFGLTSHAIFGDSAPLIGIVGQHKGAAQNMGWFVGKNMTRFVCVDTDDFNACNYFASYGPQNILLQRTSTPTTAYNGFVAINAPKDLSANRFYYLPDAGANADFVMTKGTQSIASHKSIDRLSFNQINTGHITGDYAIGVTGKQIQFVSGGATAYKIDFPTASSVAGYMFMLFNTGTATLTCYPGPFVNVPGGKGILAISNGTAWKYLGF